MGSTTLATLPYKPSSLRRPRLQGRLAMCGEAVVTQHRHELSIVTDTAPKTGPRTSER